MHLRSFALVEAVGRDESDAVRARLDRRLEDVRLNGGVAVVLDHLSQRFPEVDPVQARFPRIPARPEAELDPSVRRMIDGCRRLRENRRGPVHHACNQDAAADVLGAREQRGKHGPRLENVAVQIAADRDQVVVQPPIGEPKPLGGLPEVEDLAVRPMLLPGLYPEFHGAISGSGR